MKPSFWQRANAACAAVSAAPVCSVDERERELGGLRESAAGEERVVSRERAKCGAQV